MTRKAPVNVGEQETDKNDAVGDQNVVRRNDGKVVDDPNNKRYVQSIAIGN
jgi:hypothetical protein